MVIVVTNVNDPHDQYTGTFTQQSPTQIWLQIRGGNFLFEQTTGSINVSNETGYIDNIVGNNEITLNGEQYIIEVN